MVKRVSIVSISVLGTVGFMSGCGTSSLLDDTSSSGSDFLGISLSGFDGARTIPVREDAAASESSDVTLPEDLLTDASEEVTLVLSAPEVSVTVEEDPELLSNFNEMIRLTRVLRERHITRNDPCYCGSERKFKKCHGRR